MKLCAAAVLVCVGACWTATAAPAPAENRDAAAAAALKRDSAQCRQSSDIDACYDAIRWNPNDPALLTSLGDALDRAHRPEDALRNYQRAATVAPATRGLAAKISAVEAKLAAARARGKGKPNRGADSARHYSNGAPETQSH